MTRYVAFLRSINTPPRHVKMARLRGTFIRLGFEDVATYIASGNVIFDTGDPSELAVRIELALETDLGFEVPTFLRTRDETVAVAEREPFPRHDGEHEVSFLSAEPSTADARALEATASDSDLLAVIGREVYWCPRGPLRDSTHSEAHVARILGMATTRRSMRTVQGLARAHLNWQAPDPASDGTL